MTFTIELMVSLGGFFIAIVGLLAGAWWRITIMINGAKSEMAVAADRADAKASFAVRELAEHKLHVAESYVSKDGMREITNQIMGAIEGIGNQMTEMRGRIDRLLEKSPPRTATRS